MSIRKSIAAWLDPEMAKDSRRHWFLRQKLSEASDWLGVDFPVVAAVIHWAKVSEVVHFSRFGDKLPEHVPGKPWIHQIHEFRAHLQRTYLATTPGGDLLEQAVRWLRARANECHAEADNANRTAAARHDQATAAITLDAAANEIGRALKPAGDGGEA